MLKRHLLAGMAALGLVATFATGALAAHDFKIVYIGKNTGNPYFDSINGGFVDACKQIGCQYEFVAPATAEATSQIPIIEAQIQRGVNVIAIAPNSPDAMNQVLDEARAKGMLQISGPGAGAQVEALSTLLEAAPALRPQVVAAEWIGNRRWNLTFKTGQVLALPQGDEPGAKALIEFARLDGVNRLIGGKVVAFDMRTPERIYMRCPECAAENKPSVVEGGTT